MLTKTRNTNNYNAKQLNSAIDLMPTGDFAEKILRERANRIAKQESSSKESGIIITPYIRIVLGKNERYGIPYVNSKEVVQHVVVSKLPHVPDYVVGVTNRRGTLLTVIDLNQFLNRKPTEHIESAPLIVINDNNTSMGLLVTDIEGSDECDLSALEKPLSADNTLNQKIIVGLHKTLTALINVPFLTEELKKALMKEVMS